MARALRRRKNAITEPGVGNSPVRTVRGATFCAVAGAEGTVLGTVQLLG